MSTKQMVLEAVAQLPEDSTFDRIKEEIEILARIREGLADADAGRVTPHEQVRDLIDKWTAR